MPLNRLHNKSFIYKCQTYYILPILRLSIKKENGNKIPEFHLRLSVNERLEILLASIDEFIDLFGLWGYKINHIDLHSGSKIKTIINERKVDPRPRLVGR